MVWWMLAGIVIGTLLRADLAATDETISCRTQSGTPDRAPAMVGRDR
jgi:hypothetical protein